MSKLYRKYLTQYSSTHCTHLPTLPRASNPPRDLLIRAMATRDHHNGSLLTRAEFLTAIGFKIQPTSIKILPPVQAPDRLDQGQNIRLLPCFGDRIQAIKAIREVSTMGLSESAALVDCLRSGTAKTITIEVRITYLAAFHILSKAGLAVANPIQILPVELPGITGAYSRAEQAITLVQGSSDGAATIATRINDGLTQYVIPKDDMRRDNAIRTLVGAGLKIGYWFVGDSAVATLESMFNGPHATQITIQPVIKDHFVNSMSDRGKISAIKAIREITSLGLKEAKCLVDSLVGGDKPAVITARVDRTKAIQWLHLFGFVCE